MDVGLEECACTFNRSGNLCVLSLQVNIHLGIGTSISDVSIGNIDTEVLTLPTPHRLEGVHKDCFAFIRKNV